MKIIPLYQVYMYLCVLCFCFTRWSLTRF